LALALLASIPNMLLAEAKVGENIALGKPYKMDDRPSYIHCTDPGDATQLTDGQRSEGGYWTDRRTVGWTGKPFVVVTIDLGRIEPIAGLMIRSAAGRAGVFWAGSIAIQFSDDDKEYFEVGDLVQLDVLENGPISDGFQIHELTTKKLKIHGRYLRFVIVSKSLFCADEIEVYRGDNRLLEQPIGGKPVVKAANMVKYLSMKAGLGRRYLDDRFKIAQQISSSGLANNLNDPLLRRLEELGKAAADLTIPESNDFKAILPYNPTHARMYEVQAEL
jgi:F5/8 type C domain